MVKPLDDICVGDLDGFPLVKGRILDKIAKERVFEILYDKAEDAYIFIERCDSYFAVVLTRDELRALAEELIDVTGDGHQLRLPGVLYVPKYGICRYRADGTRVWYTGPKCSQKVETDSVIRVNPTTLFPAEAWNASNRVDAEERRGMVENVSPFHPGEWRVEELPQSEGA